MNVSSIDPYSKESMPMERLREFGVKIEISNFKQLDPPIPRLFRRGIVQGHRDFEEIVDAINHHEYFVAISGIMPTGPLHLGHKMVIDQLKFYQERGGNIFVCIADMEARSMRRISYEKGAQTGYDYIKYFIALGLKPNNCHFYFQSGNQLVKNFAYDEIMNNVTFSELSSIYGFDVSSKEGEKITPRVTAEIFAHLLQAADILHLQLPTASECYKDFEGKLCPTVVPVGVEQDPNLRLTRGIANKFKLTPPTSTYHVAMPSLISPGLKMSKTNENEEGIICLSDKVVDGRRKVMNAYTGGRTTAKEQRERGGEPDKCVVYTLYKFHLIEEDEELKQIRNKCESGEVVCGDCKEQAARLMGEMLQGLREGYKEAEDKLDKYNIIRPKQETLPR